MDVLPFFTAKAFEVISLIMSFIAATGKQLDEIADYLKEIATETGAEIGTEINELYDRANIYFRDSDSVKRADEIYKNIKSNPESVKYCTPEARGKLIAAIFEAAEVRGFSALSLMGRNEDYELAIVLILRWVQNQKDFKHTICHSLPGKSYKYALAYFEDFLDGAQDIIFNNIKSRFPITFFLEFR